MVIKKWFSSVRSFFRFIKNRKVTEKFGLLPDIRILLAVICTVLISIGLMYFYADPIYMEWFMVSNTDDPDSIYTKTTDLAQSHLVLVPTGIIILLISVFKVTPAFRNELTIWHHRFMMVYFIFTTIAFSGLLTLLLKNIFGRVRPNFYDGASLWQSFPFSGEYGFTSFPSGHATTAGAIAMVAYLFIPKVSPLFALFAIWIAITRLGVGAHYPADVTAGLFVGAIFTWLYARSFARKRLLFRFDMQGKLMLRRPYGSR